MGGALQSPVVTPDLAERLAQDLAVILYDRRGRGGSGDTSPYTVEREIDDLAALLAQAGGTACVYGHSSGSGLALRAATRGLPITSLILHDAPFATDDDARAGADELDEKIRALLAEGRPDDAVELFFASLGLPPDMSRQLSQDPALSTLARTLPYDFAVLRDTDDSLTDMAAGVTIPALVISSATAPEWVTAMSRQVADSLPAGRHVLLESRWATSSASDDLAPVVAEFVTTSTSNAGT